MEGMAEYSVEEGRVIYFECPELNMQFIFPKVFELFQHLENYSSGN